MQVIKPRQFPVQWHEGMLLSPQHFQQDQVYRDTERSHQLTMSEPYYWGFVNLKLDLSSLISGTFKLAAIYAMMPDGLIVNYDERYDAEVSVDLSSSPSFKQGGDTATIHLVVPIRDKNAAFQRAEIQRFDSIQENEPVVDENTGENAVEVYRLKPRYGLYVGESVPGKYISMPIAKIRKDNDGTYKTTEYVPPVRRLNSAGVASADILYTHLERLVEALRQKAVQLSGISESNITGLSREMRAQKRLMSEIIGTVLPSLELAITSDISPFNVYANFCNAIGRLVKLTENPVPPKLPAYNHNNLHNSFSTVVAFLVNLINTIKSQFKLLKFDLDQQTFRHKLEKSINNDVLTIEVRGEQGTNERTLVEFIQSARIVSQPYLDDVDKKRLLGAKRKILAKPIFELESDRARIVVQLSLSDPLIIAGENLIITSANQKSSIIMPESIWLYSA